MNIEIDEQTLVATLLFGGIGVFLYLNPHYQALAMWVGGAILAGNLAIAAIVMVLGLTEMMWWDALRAYTRGESGD